MGRYISVLLVLSALLLPGCLMKPLSGVSEVNATVVPGSGCAYQNPACGQGYECVNDTCLALAAPAPANASPAPQQSGCAYDNPACGADYDCVNDSCVEKVICGKFGCQQGENYSNCCTDCGCPAGYTCGPDNACSLSVGQIIVENVSVVPLSPVVLYAVPSKTIEKGVGPVIKVVLENSGNAAISDLIIKPEVQGYTGIDVYDVGAIAPGASLVFNYTPAFVVNPLTQAGNSTVRLELGLQYSSEGANGTGSFATDIALQPMDYFDWRVPEAAAAWADSEDPSVSGLALDATLGAQPKTDADIEREARQIFGDLQARTIQVQAGQDPCYSDTLAFPADVLKARYGDCASLSVLFAACLEAAGMRSAVIKTPDAVLAAYDDLEGSLVPIDMRDLESSDFAGAMTDGASELSNYSSDAVIVYPEDQWGLGVQKVMPGTQALSSIITTTAQTCRLLPGTLTVNYWFANEGYDAGRRCVNATVYEGTNIYVSKMSCVDVYVNDKKNVTFTITGLPTNTTLDANCSLD
jgi:hypothetical protein